jgi:hypothetical protein
MPGLSLENRKDVHSGLGLHSAHYTQWMQVHLLQQTACELCVIIERGLNTRQKRASAAIQKQAFAMRVADAFIPSAPAPLGATPIFQSRM